MPQCLSDITFEDFCKLPMVYVQGLRTDKGAHRVYINKEYGLQKELVTRFSQKTFKWGKGKLYFFLDGDKTTYKSAKECYEALIKKLRT
jgi:hypothetical protein